MVEKPPDSNIETTKQRARLILDACERYSKGGNRDQEIWFFRGVSITDLDEAVHSGYLRGQEGQIFEGEKGDVWVEPIATRINSPFVARYDDPNEENDYWSSLKDAQTTAARYARSKAQDQAMMDAVGASLGDHEIHGAIFELSMAADEDILSLKDAIETLMTHSEFSGALTKLVQKFGSIESLAKLLEKAVAEKPKGVVIGIHKKILDDATSVGIEDEGLRIGVGERGLRLEDISTIYMPGSDGKVYIEKLKKLVG